MLLSQITEMAGPAQVCTTCGQGPLHKTHTYYKGVWKCKKAALAKVGLPSGATATPALAGTPRISPAASSLPVQAPVTSTALPKKVTPAKKAVSSTPANTALPTTIEGKIKAWLERFGVENYELTPDNGVTVNGDVHFAHMHWKQLPVTFGEIHGDFVCSGGYLHSLHNAPTLVDGDFMVNHNELQSLIGFPSDVTGSVSIAYNHQITSFEGMSDVTIGEDFDCRELAPTFTLHNIHKHIKHIGGELHSNATSNVLGVLLIRGLEKITLIGNPEVADIINTHLTGERDIHACQEDLIEAGFGAYAKL